MMTSRRALAALLALLATSPALAQKPTPEDLDPVRSRYRDQALAACVADLNAADNVGPDSSESVCGCAVGRFMPRWPTGGLPPLENGHIPMSMSADILPCAGEENPALAAAIARRLAEASVSRPPPVVAVPADKPQAPPERQSASPGFQPESWFDGLSLPRWLTDTGLPAWAWVPLALFVFLFLRGLFRRGEGNDLLGPPSAMRRTSAPRPRGRL